MFRPILIAAALAAFTLTACDGGDDEADVAVTPESTPANPATIAEAEPPSATTAAGFVARASMSDLYEVEASRLALERSQSPDVKAFAQSMIDEHSRMSNQLMAAVAQAGLNATPPVVLDSERTALMEALRGASPADFDSRYIDQQIESHENTLNLVRGFANNGDNDLLKQLATRAVPIIEGHLRTARALNESEAAGAPGAT
jgi:putative membrane protein